MEDTAKQPLIVSSIAGLWSTYMSDSLAICMFKHFLNHVNDKETKDLLQFALNLSEQHIKQITNFFNQESIPTLMLLEMVMLT